MKSSKCIVYGCENKTDEGAFFRGIICMPCYQMLSTGKVDFGDTFIHKLNYKKLRAAKMLGEIKAFLDT